MSEFAHALMHAVAATPQECVWWVWPHDGLSVKTSLSCGAILTSDRLYGLSPISGWIADLLAQSQLMCCRAVRWHVCGACVVWRVCVTAYSDEGLRRCQWLRVCLGNRSDVENGITRFQDKETTATSCAVEQYVAMHQENGLYHMMFLNIIT